MLLGGGLWEVGQDPLLGSFPLLLLFLCLRVMLQFVCMSVKKNKKDFRLAIFGTLAEGWSGGQARPSPFTRGLFIINNILSPALSVV